MIKFSLLVPCYNAEKYIARCLNSLINQEYKDYEIIVLDDGSTDNSYEILKKYKNKIRLYKQSNKGVSAARNKLIDLSNGKYFIFVDADDFVELNMLKIVDQYLNENIDILKFNYDIISNNEKILKDTDFSNEIKEGKTIIDDLLDSRIVFDMPCTYVFRKKYFTDNQFQFEVGRFHEDFGLIPFVINSAKKVKLINNVLYHYYQSDNSLTRTSDQSKEYIKALDTLYFFQKYKDSECSKKLKSYAANAVLWKYRIINQNYKKEYKRRIKDIELVDYLLDDTIARKIKKIIWKIKI